MKAKHLSLVTSPKKPTTQSQSFSDAILEASPFAVCIFHPQTHKLLYNNVVADELMTKLDLTNSVREFWQTLLIEESDFYQQLGQKGHIHDYEICRNDLSGQTVWLVLSCDMITFHEETSYCLWIRDISSRKKAEERLQDAVDTISDCFLLWDKDDRLVVCNEKFFELFPNTRDICTIGRTYEEVMHIGFGRGDFELPEGLTQAEWIKKRIAAHKSGNYIDIRQIKGRWLQIREQRTSKGNIVTTAIDIDHLKEKERELEIAKEKATQAEEHLRDALDTMSGAFMLWDKDDRLINYNKKLFEDYYPESKDVYVIGRTFEEVMHIGFTKGDFGVPEGWTQKEWIKKRVAAHKSGDYADVRCIKGRWLQIKDQRTAQGHIVTTAIDVGHLKEKERQLEIAKEQASQTEEYLRDALDTMEGAFMLWDKDDQLIIHNKKLFEHYPQSQDIYVLGRTFEKVMETGFDKGDFEIPKGWTQKEWIKKRIAFHKSGNHLDVKQVKGRWLQIRDQRTARGNIIITAMDVGHLKEKEHQLETALEEAIIARAQAEKATQAKSQFLAMMSHEIRTPLQGIINMGQLLMTSIVHHEQHDKLMTILRSSEALLTILNDALDIAKVEAGKLSITNTAFDLKKLIEGVMIMYTLPVQEKNLQFSYSIDPKLPRYLKGDAPKIRQILFNFIDNALKFTPNSGKISVRCEVRPSKHFGQIKLYMGVTDTGIGISEEAQHHLFKEFTQANDTIAHQFGGCGLGLSICKKMIDSLEGEIGVESKSKKGSTFWVMVDGLEPTDRFDSFNWYYGHKNHTNLPSQRVLLVEDNVLNQKSTLEVLQYLDHKVTVVPDGIEALRELKRKSFDLVITDLQMPRLDGYDLIHSIRSLPEPKNSVPIMTLTARASEEDAEACLKAGVTRHLAKPITMWALQQAMAEVLGYHHDTDQDKKDAGRNAYYQEQDQQDDFQLVSVDQAVLKSLSTVLPYNEMVGVIEDYQQAVDKNFKQKLLWTLKEEDYTNAHNITSNFRCLSGTLGLSRLVKRLESLETAIKDKEHERIYDYYHQAEEELDSVVPTLKSFYEAKSKDLASQDKNPDLLVSPNTKKTPFHHVKTLYFLSQDQNLSREIQDQLNNYGYDIKACTTLKKLETVMPPQDKPFLLLIDLDRLNKKDDVISFCQALEERQEAPCYVMATSCYDDLTIRRKAVHLGAHDFYAKPVDYSTLVDKLDQLTLVETPEPYRVLLIDDDTFMNKLHSNMLQKGGMVIRMVQDPTTIMPVLYDFQPDVILMDLNMPECNGLELSRIIRQHPTLVGIPIVFLSGERNYAKHVAAMQWGGDEFLTKPIDAPRLIEAVTLRVERLRKLRSYMIRDSLTGLLNHSTIQDNLATHVLQAKRQETLLSFALIDIDEFKAVNDTYGHPIGDRIIKSLSRYLKQHLRRTDIVGRYGGEEFAIILPNTSGPEAKKVIDKIRKGFASLQHTTDKKQTIKVPFSAGLAEYPVIKSWPDLIKKADEKLYDAKRKGRNCTVLDSKK